MPEETSQSAMPGPLKAIKAHMLTKVLDQLIPASAVPVKAWGNQEPGFDRALVAMMGAKKASPTKPTPGSKPLSPGSNYPATKNIQTQSNGFGTFVQKFTLAKGKTKYGVPVFLPNGNVNPAYLAAERKEMAAQSKNNRKTRESSACSRMTCPPRS